VDEYTIDQSLKAYERIERGLVEFSEQIPIIPANEIIKAPVLIPFIVDACGLMDSLLRDLTPETVVIGSQTLKRYECDITDFATLHAKNLDLPNTRSVLLVSPPSYRRPFEPWEALLNGGSYMPLSWWQDYNALKHDRLLNIEKGILETALDAVCALHQVIARRLDLIPILIRRGWFSTGNWVIDAVLDDVRSGLLPDTFIVQTRLFATPVGRCQFPLNFSDLHPALFQCNREFIEFLGKSY
jgi:hypothetical protein